MKVLNIDALVTPKRVLNLGGERHVVKELSAQQFVDSLAKSDKLDADVAAGLPGATKVDIFNENVQMVLDLVPTLKREVLMPLPLTAVVTILKFCRGDDDDIAVEEEGGAGPK
jgi:hypothetical protein